MGKRGIGLIEVIMAAAILMVAAVGISTYIVNSHNFEMKIEGAASCRGNVEALLSQYANNSSLAISNFLPYANTPGTRSLASLPTMPYATTVTGTNQYRTYQNIENSVTKAFLLLSSAQATYCDPPNGGLVTNANKATLFSDTTSFDAGAGTIEGKNVFLKVTPFDVATQTALACNNRDISPLSTENSVHQKVLQVRIGIQNPATGETCTGTTIVKYNIDMDQPSAAGTTFVPSNCGIIANLRSDEPGSVFECSINGSPFRLCDGTNIAGIAANYSATLGINNAGMGNTTTLATANIGGFLDDGGVSVPVSFRAVDTAGNRSPAVAAPNVSCCIDSTWNPDPATECAGKGFTQTSNCGNTRLAFGTGGACPGPVCAQVPGSLCTGNQYSEWPFAYASIFDGCANPSVCTTCDYAVNRCTSAGKVSCLYLFADPMVPGNFSIDGVCWANFDADGAYDCAGVCHIGPCGVADVCVGFVYVHQAADCTITPISYGAPQCP